MKRLAFIFVAVLTLVIFSSAQSDSFIVADVPFSFHVKDNHAVAGTYRISYQGSCKEFLAITGGDNFATVAGLTFPEPQTDKKATPKLIFNKFGGEYFLVGIQMSTDQMWKVPLNKRALVDHRIVLTKAQPEEVVIIARLSK